MHFRQVWWQCTPRIGSHYWFSWWFGTIRQHAITWASVDQDARLHLMSCSVSPVFGAFYWFDDTHRGRRIAIFRDDVIKWKHFRRYWPFVRGIHWSAVNSPHKGQWRGALMFSFVCAWINGWVNNREAGDLRRHRDHYDVTVVSQIWGIHFTDVLNPPIQIYLCFAFICKDSRFIKISYLIYSNNIPYFRQM